MFLLALKPQTKSAPQSRKGEVDIEEARLLIDEVQALRNDLTGIDDSPELLAALARLLDMAAPLAQADLSADPALQSQYDELTDGLMMWHETVRSSLASA